MLPPLDPEAILQAPRILFAAIVASALGVSAQVPPPEPAEAAMPPPGGACPAPTHLDLDGGSPTDEEADDEAAEGKDDEADEKDSEGAALPGAATAVDPEAESHEAATDLDPALHYTKDLSDDDIKKLWKANPDALGSMSVGFADSGRLINGVQVPKDGNWLVVSPEGAWGTRETVEFILAAVREVSTRFPGTPPLRINHLSKKDGGYLRPHKSHQSGRDVDLAFYYPTADPVRVRNRENCIDVGRNWALVRALVVNGDVQQILVDRRIQKVLYDYALSIGEDRAWLDSLFRNGHDSILQHAKRHRDHFHVRFFNARAQELGRRVQPLLALRPEHNVVTHRIRSGDNLGSIARRYGTTIQLIMRANGMRKSFLRAGHMLNVPLRGPCTKCPLPPVVVVPPRRLPPEKAVAEAPIEEPREAAVPAGGGGP